MLDVSFVINDPLISNKFDVRRQSEAVGLNGRVTKVPEWFRQQRGVIKPEKGDRLERTSAEQVAEHTISVRTSFALRDARFGYQPDVVLWKGVEYLVVRADPYQELAGYTLAICTSTRGTDTPQ